MPGWRTRHRLPWLATYCCVFAAFLVVSQSPNVSAQDGGFNRQIDYHAMTSAEQTAARRAAKKRKFDQLVFCADPGNMPLSNNLGEGYQNRIAAAVARKMNARLRYFWRPFFERGLTRETFDNKQCEIIIELPADYQHILTSIPIYRSSYVFATRKDADFEITNFDDPDLRSRRVGVFQHSAVREALSRHGVKEGLELHVVSYDADLRTEKQPWNQVQKVVEGKLDIAGVWGPFAGWLQVQGEPIQLTPANMMEDQVVLEFDLAYGIRTNDVVLKYALDFALLDAQEEIADILEEFGVPLVQCAQCVVSGDLPSQGTYFKNIVKRSTERFTEPVPDHYRRLEIELASEDQVMTIDRVKEALANGSDILTELNNAVIASDELRVKYLLGIDADVNEYNLQGVTPLITAARNRDVQMMRLLLDHDADINKRDRSDLTPLHYAVLRNHVPSVEFLAENGADLAVKGYAGLTPLASAISEGMRWVAAALIRAGAPIDDCFGEGCLTALMVLATQDESHTRRDRVIGGPSVVDIAEQLVDRGADVNGTTSQGVTALMIAAGGDHINMLAFLLKAGANHQMKNDSGNTALDIAKLSGSQRSIQAFANLVGNGQ